MKSFSKVVFDINTKKKKVTASILVRDLEKECTFKFKDGNFQNYFVTNGNFANHFYDEVSKYDECLKFINGKKRPLKWWELHCDNDVRLTGTAICSEGDTFDIEEGKRIARDKLYRKIYNIKKKVLTKLLVQSINQTDLINQELAYAVKQFTKYDTNVKLKKAGA